ncbi:MAG: hypothetical protein WCS17_03490 [Prevotella sp.]
MNEPALIRKKKSAHDEGCSDEENLAIVEEPFTRIPSLPFVDANEPLKDLPLSDIIRTAKKLTDKDLVRISKMARNMSSPSTIARAIGLTEADLYSTENIIAFQAVFTRARAVGQAILQDTQFQLARSGNTAMLIHLGKAYLDQKEEITISHSVADPSLMSIDDLYLKLAEGQNDGPKE